MSENYDGSQIVVLEGLEAVRKRPGMYIGSTGIRGLHHLIWEILDNGIDEHLAGFCKEIDIVIKKDGGITVRDYGRGVPVDIHPTKKIPTERVVYTVLHAGGKFTHGAYKVSGGLHGVGASVVNALSKKMIVEIRRDGLLYRDEYENGGHPITKLVKGELPSIRTCKGETGTSVTFYPDDTIFETVEFKPEIIKKKLKETAFLNKGLKVNYKNEITEEDIIYEEKDGIKSYIKYINREAEVINEDVIYVEGESGDIEVEVAFQYTNSFSEQINAFCNRINVVDGGTLVTGFKMALTRVINQYARELNYLKAKDENFDGGDIRNGIVAIISIKHPDPQFEGQTKTKLGNTDAKTAVDDVVSREIVMYFDKNIEVLKSILDLAQKSYNARNAGDKARTAALKSLNEFDSKSKLASCSSKMASECEIYLVEGDSAGGTVKTARNRKTQAVLPLRGKILNVEKSPLEKVLVNNEIKSMIASFGCGIGEDFDIKKLRYDKIIILTDADVDGAHISTLLLTFFYRFMPDLIKEGKVYRGLPPLYRVTYEENVKENLPVKEKLSNGQLDIFQLGLSTDNSKKTKVKTTKKKCSRYIFDDYEMEKFRKKNHKILEVQRYKGLGEMDASQLKETTLDPKTRVLARIDISDTVEADEVTNLLMGSVVSPRRDFIMREARYAKLDV